MLSGRLLVGVGLLSLTRSVIISKLLIEATKNAGHKFTGLTALNKRHKGAKHVFNSFLLFALTSHIGLNIIMFALPNTVVIPNIFLLLYLELQHSL